MTATDSRGLKGSKTIRIDPETRQLTLASSPPGARVTYAGSDHTAPFVHQATIGFSTQVSAAGGLVHEGKAYEFAGWSDGGAQLHEFTMPASATTLTASYAELEQQSLAVLLVAGSTALGAADQAVKQRLEAGGHTVEVADDGLVTSAAAGGKDLVVISPSAGPAAVNSKFRTTAVPVLVSEPWLFDDMKMTGSSAFGVFGNSTMLAIQNPSHPLAAGLSGIPAVTSAPSYFNWGSPTASAAKVATLKNSSGATIFGYEKGAAMVSLAAPARRVGFFLHDQTAASLTAQGWSLFDAAVIWARGS